MSNTLTRRQFLKRMGKGIVGTAAIAGLGPMARLLAQESRPQEANIEKNITDYFRTLGINLHQLSRHDLRKLTNLDQPLLSPLAIYNGEKRTHPQVSAGVEFRKKVLQTERQIIVVRLNEAYRITITLPTEDDIKPEQWIKYIDVRTHLVAVNSSLGLFPKFFEQTTQEQKLKVESFIHAVRLRIQEIESLPGYQHVKTSQWIEPGAKRIGREMTEITLTAEQKKYRDQLIASIESHSSLKIKNSLHTILWIVYYESGFNPKNVNREYQASGLFQIIPSTWKHIQQLKGQDPNQYPFERYRLDPNVNTDFGLTLFAEEGEKHWSASRHLWGPYVEKGIQFPRD